MRWSCSVSMMFREHPVRERIAAARAAGFDGVEIQVPAEADADVWAAAQAGGGIPVALMNVDLGDFLAGGAGLSGVPGREAAFRAAAEDALALAPRVGCTHLHLGPSRVAEGSSREAGLAVLEANLAWLAPRAQQRGVQLLVEPLNRVETPTALLARLDEAVDFITSVRARGLPLALQFDAYHVAANGEDPAQAFERVRELVAHVQFADHPGRKPPGAGQLDFDRLMRCLRAAGYDGWCGAEYLAPSGAAATLDWLPRLKAIAA